MSMLNRMPFLQKLVFLMIPVFVGPASADDPLAHATLSPGNNQPVDSLVLPNEEPDRNGLSRNDGNEQETADASGFLPKRTPHAGIQADLFSSHSWYVPPAPPPVRARTEPVERVPTAPPLPFSYIGQYEQDGIDTLFYLVKGDRVYDVKIGDVIDNTYKIDGVANGQLMFTYLPLNASQGLRLGDQQ